VSTRDPDETRRSLLEAAFKEIYEVGFRAASVDRILRSTGVTKGALYHHFKSKSELGYAVVDELLAQYVLDGWVKPLARKSDPIDLIKTTIAAQVAGVLEAGNYSKGCPLNNLSVEMSQIDEGFRTRIELVFRIWRDALGNVLRRGQQQGILRADFDPERTAYFVISALEGIASMAKNAPLGEPNLGPLDPLYDYLDGLRYSNSQVA